MMSQLIAVRDLWASSGIENKHPVTEQDIMRFQSKTGLVLTEDISQYFLCLNGTAEKYDDNLFSFRTLNEFKSVNEELRDWAGTPNYANIVNTLPNSQSCYVFADYMFHLFVYAVRLHEHRTEINEVYVLCEDEYKVVAASFTEFLALYLTDFQQVFL